jgi:predicted nucleotidyltransferase
VSGAEASPELDEIVRRIAARFQPERIIVFGSHARGDADPDSDIDLLIVTPVKGSRRELATEIDRELSDRTVPLDIVVMTPEQFDRERDLVGTITYPAVREGRVVYERAA